MEDAGGLCPSLSLPECRLYYQGADERQASLSYRRDCQYFGTTRKTSVPQKFRQGLEGLLPRHRRYRHAALMTQLGTRPCDATFAKAPCARSSDSLVSSS